MIYLYRKLKNKKFWTFIAFFIMIFSIILTGVAKYEQTITENNMISGLVSYNNNEGQIEPQNNEECNDFILAVWHDYANEELSNKNGGNGRTIRFYTSIDGINFTEFNQEIYETNRVNSIDNGGIVTNGWIGAPSLVYYNGLFFMVCSGNGVTPTRDASIAVSKDFVNWEWFDYTLEISSKRDTAKVAAPQLVVLDNKLYVIESVWCGETERDINDNIVYVYDSYMSEVTYKYGEGFCFGKPWLLEVYKEDGSLSPHRNHIDSTIVQTNGIYYLLTKDDTSNNIELFTSKDLHTWELKNNQLFGANYFEGQTICYYNNEWHIYADRYASTRGMNKQMVHCTTTDFETFENYSLINTENVYQCRHGDVITITDPEAKKILQTISDFQLSINEKEPKQQYFDLKNLKTVLYDNERNPIGKKCTDFVTAFNTTYQITTSSTKEYCITDLSNPFGLDEVTFEFSENAKNSTLIIESSNGVELNYIYSPEDSNSEEPLKIKFIRDEKTNALYPDPETSVATNSTRLDEIPELISKNTIFTVSPSNSPNGKVNVEISTEEKGYMLQYSTDKINWTTYSKPIEMTQKSIIYACLYDGTNRGSYTSYTAIAKDENIYDVVLFWGQSNMVGNCGRREEEREKDTSYNKDTFSEFANITGIDEEILQRTEKMNYVRVVDLENTEEKAKYNETAFEFILGDYKNGNECIKNIYEQETLGEQYKYNENSNYYSMQKSYGTNMIPQFCKTYYENTGHKVIAVFAAYGGQKIQSFLPSDDPDYQDEENKMIYEAIKEKYASAIKYMEDNGYTIGNKLYVCMQGEANNKTSGTDKDTYKKLYMKVHNNFKKDLGITKGAIVETAKTIGVTTFNNSTTKIFENAKDMHQAQEELINENDDIILGSSYAYDRYVPDEETYYSDEYVNENFVDSNGQKFDYEEAFKRASYSVCYPNNTIHLKSAALSQIGKETATQLTRVTATNPILSDVTITYDGATHEIGVSGGSGGTVNYRTSTDNSTWGAWSTLKPSLTNVGTLYVQAYVVGDETHNNSSATESKKITINKRELKVTADSKSKIYGYANPSLPYSYSGQVSGQTPKFTGMLATSATETSGVGSYDITKGNLALADNSPFLANNYTLSYTSAKLTINKKEIQKIASDFSGNYDGKAKTFTLNVTEPTSGYTIYYKEGTTALTASNYTSGTTTKPTRIAIGTTTVQWYIHTTNGNYNDISGSNTITINTDSSEKLMLGDINNDGKVDSMDLLKMLRYTSMKQTGKYKEEWDLSEQEQKKADINQDGKINAIDVLKLKRYIAASKSTLISEKHPEWLEI